MAKIKIEPEQIHKIGDRFLSCSDQNMNMAKELKSLIEGLGGEWEGNSRERFYSSYQDAHKQLESVSTILKDVGDELNAIAERFKQVDSNT
ncbi:WXG100 family type VII secretion target [Paenibacillus anaericanus]|uniref:WXG100 family type VII secretion target n=1 Tax=Paenibacillus anaericanus TaxID=170367 RepID=UPI00277F1FB7|nr:WXG100 family type VII secretion target [Paenibacillus anaericanus]MDQ0087466.1 WXG100 family type VII secretion target [Paenibacillus anaericanus]